jgi:hypothetical protein
LRLVRAKLRRSRTDQPEIVFREAAQLAPEPHEASPDRATSAAALLDAFI